MVYHRLGPIINQQGSARHPPRPDVHSSTKAVHLFGSPRAIAGPLSRDPIFLGGPKRHEPKCDVCKGNKKLGDSQPWGCWGVFDLLKNG